MDSLEERRCAKCGFVARKVFAMSVCEHRLCQDCAKELGGPTAKCPVCSKFGEIKALNSIPEIDHHEFVACPNADPLAYRTGAPRCKWEGLPIDIDLHVERDCQLTQIKCWYSDNGCTFSGPRWKMIEHEKNCEFRPIKCKYCGSEQPFLYITEHENHCPEMIVSCPNCCDKNLHLKLGDLQAHLLTCPAAHGSCDICSLCQTYNRNNSNGTKAEDKNHLETDHETKLLALKHNILESELSLKEEMLKELELLFDEMRELDDEITKREEKVMLLNEQLSIPVEARPSRAPSKLIDVTLLKSKTQNELIKSYMDSAMAQLKEKNERIAELKALLSNDKSHE